MTSSQSWILATLTQSQPAIQWNASTNLPANASTALNFSDGGNNGKRFAIYQPVYLHKNISYNFDCLVKNAAITNANLQVYITPTIIAGNNDDFADINNYQNNTLGTLSAFNSDNWTNLPYDGSFAGIAVKGSAAPEGEPCIFTPDNDGIYFLTFRFATWYSGAYDISVANMSLTAETPAELTWQGIDNNWNNPDNWNNFLPESTTTVTIPGGKNYYPVLTQQKNIQDIILQHGGQIGRPDLLNYQKAHVQLDFSKPGMTNRWNMWSMPIQGVVSGDLAFGGQPSVYLRKFDASANPDNGSSFIQGAWTDYYNSNKIGFAPGEGFIIWVRNNNTTNLQAIGNVLELPCFANTNENGENKGNPFHRYDSNNNTSTFEWFSAATGTGASEEPLNRGDNAHHLNTSDVSREVTFVNGFALVGNPYPSSLDFAAFASTNSSKIKPEYKIFNGNTFDDELTGAIAPFQSFLVESAGDDEATVTLDFSVANHTSVSTATALRNSEIIANKLDIVVSNGTATGHTSILNRADGSVEYGYADSRKILMGIIDIPEIYTIKGSGWNKTGVCRNVVNTDNILIPVGLATSYAGEMQFTFSGIAGYDADIRLIDYAENREIPLTGDEAVYSFIYAPKTVNNQVTADEERFAIRFIPKVMTAIDAVTDNRIKEIYVYNLQGQLIYANNRINSLSYNIPASVNMPEIVVVKTVTNQGVNTEKVIRK
jgi:hypothetical protein